MFGAFAVPVIFSGESVSGSPMEQTEKWYETHCDCYGG